MGPLTLMPKCRTGGCMPGLASLGFCGREKCVVSGVSAYLGLVIMVLTCGWQVSSVGDHEVRVVLCVFSSHLRYI